MKLEDFEKFKKDKINAEVLEKKKKISRLTIRSKAAKSIEKISRKSMSIVNWYRKILERSFFCTKESA